MMQKADVLQWEEAKPDVVLAASVWPARLWPVLFGCLSVLALLHLTLICELRARACRPSPTWHLIRSLGGIS